MSIRVLKRAIRGTLARLGYEIRKQEPPTLSVGENKVGLVAPSPPSVPNTLDMAIVSAARKNLASATAHEATVKLPSYGTRWQPQAMEIRNAIESFADPVQCLRYAQTRISFDHRESGGYVQDLPRIQLYDDLVRHEFPWFGPAMDVMKESPLSVEESLVNIRDRYVSNIFYWHVRYVLACMTYLPSPKRILEIGGGYGAPARLWMTNPISAVSSYCMVDIPECLFFAEVALKQEFGNAVGYFDGTDPGTAIVLVPISRLKDFSRPSDLVVNTGSLQEMTDEWVDYYMTWLDGYGARYFYSVNYAAQPLSTMAESRNLWSPRPSAQWSTRYLNVDVPLIRAQGPNNDFLEAIYEREPAKASLKDWSVRRGHVLSRATYVEGLDLLRQDLNTADALSFLNFVLAEFKFVPKEALWIVNWLDSQQVPEASEIRQRLSLMKGGETHPYGARS